MAHVAKVRHADAVELVDEAEVRSALRTGVLVAERLDGRDQDVMNLEFAGRVEQKRCLEAGRNSLSVGRLRLAFGGRPGRVTTRSETQRLLSVGVAVRHDVGGQTASSRADDARIGVRGNDALTPAQSQAGLSEGNDLHRLIVAAGAGQKETRGACPIGAPRSEGGRGNGKRCFSVPLPKR